MGTIKVLSEQIANKIAAGEVVERPASVVKELVENALDARATKISVLLKYGGKGLIRVKDNGHGMDRNDACSCILRHATSKISAAEEIETIQTLGFRGEALPSIAAVSRFTLTTRRAADETATKVVVTGGVVDATREEAAIPGTTIEVADLFYNTPARKKFLKSNPAEYAATLGIFDTLSLSRHDVSFSLSRDDKEIASYLKCDDLFERARQLFPPEYTEKLYPIAVEKQDFSVRGFVGSPENTRINRTGQKFFINRRPVQSIAFSIALSRAYEEFLQPRRFPVAILFFDIDPTYVDVNVHPTKREVRLQSERFFQDTLVKAIRTQLNKKGVFGGAPSPPPRAQYPERPRPSSGISFNSLKKIETETAGVKAPLSVREHAAAFTPKPFPAAGRGEQRPAMPERPHNPFGVERILGQVHGAYIVVETREGLGVFDQHAAHERVMYEELLGLFARRRCSSQQLLFPVVMHLNRREAAVMQECLEDLHKLGFSINPLGDGTVSVDAVPACMPEGDAAAIVTDTLHEVMEQPFGSGSWESSQHELAAILACKTYTVKAGKVLDEQEMSHLIERLGFTKNPHTCPHGRPTFFPVTKEEIEKRFKRT